MSSTFPSPGIFPAWATGDYQPKYGNPPKVDLVVFQLVPTISSKSSPENKLLIVRSPKGISKQIVLSNKETKLYQESKNHFLVPVVICFKSK